MESQQYVCYLWFDTVSFTVGDCVSFTAQYLANIDSSTTSFKVHEATVKDIKVVIFCCERRGGNSLTCHQKVTSRKVKGLFLSFADFHHFILLLGFFFSFICEPYDLVELFHLYLPSSKFFAHLLCLDHRTDVQYLYHAAKHASHRRIWSIISNIQIKKIALRQMRLTSLPQCPKIAMNKFQNSSTLIAPLVSIQYICEFKESVVNLSSSQVITGEQYYQMKAILWVHCKYVVLCYICRNLLFSSVELLKFRFTLPLSFILIQLSS